MLLTSNIGPRLRGWPASHAQRLQKAAHLSDLLKQAPQHGEMGMPVWMIGCFELPSQPPAEPPQLMVSC